MLRPRAVALLAACLALAAPGAGAEESVEVALGAPESMHALRVSAAGGEDMPIPARAPLGSLWKLFVHVYLADAARPAPDYRCTGRDPDEEAYCCDPGGSIGRDAALAKSCGLFFSPRRLGITGAAWKAYWQQRAPGAPAWLLDLDSLAPATEVTVESLLAALAAIDPASRSGTLAALAQVGLETRGRPLLAHLGAGLRVKTWSWKDAKGRRSGGFAGWLGDGTPVWVRGSGTSAQVIDRAAPWLAAALPNPRPGDDACVRVRFFARYPLAEVRVDGHPATPGPLRGEVAARFANGRRLAFTAAGDLALAMEGSQPRIDGRFGMNDYLARVIEREAAPEPAAAARALAVAARTWLVRHAGFGGGCYEIDDDSRSQRVSPHPPGTAALAAAAWSDGLVLDGADGRYHLTRAGPGRLAWQPAVAWAKEGLRWDEILERAYGSAGFARVGETDAGECRPLPAADAWLATRQPEWRRRLAGTPGFEAPDPLPRVCRLDHGNPYADLGRRRIYAAGVGSANDRLTLAHEYLHFALANHPRGRDEDFVESAARSLLAIP